MKIKRNWVKNSTAKFLYNFYSIISKTPFDILEGVLRYKCNIVIAIKVDFIFIG